MVMVSTSTLRLTASDIDVALLLVGPDHRVSFANIAAHRLLGYPQGGLYGLPLERLVPHARLSELQNVDAVFKGQGSRRVRSIVTRASGGPLEVSMGVDPCFDDNGKVVAVSVRYESLSRASTGSRGLKVQEDAPTSASGLRLDGSRVARLVGEQLGGVTRLLGVLDEHLKRVADEPRMLDYARGVLAEARDLVEECELDLAALAPKIEAIPKAPRLPRG